MARRSAGRLQMARALWYVKPGVAELRSAPLEPLRPGQCRVRALYSGVSRGTERLVCQGRVGSSEWNRMRAPHQEGDFPFPVKYGYCATGVVEQGPPELLGREVFCLHPHQDVFVVAADMVTLLPEGLPARRATLAANMETTLNAMWDAGAGPGDRIVVVGAGVVGLLVASLAARLPGTEVTVVDRDADRAATAASLGAGFALPEAAPTGADVVFHASASGAGLNTAIASAGFEGRIVELSWYGDKRVEIDLGGDFHSQRLQLVSTQVGQVASRRRARWSYRRRMEKALTLLGDARLDTLVREEISFSEAPRLLPALLNSSTGLAPVLSYPPAA